MCSEATRMSRDRQAKDMRMCLTISEGRTQARKSSCHAPEPHGPPKRALRVRGSCEDIL